MTPDFYNNLVANLPQIFIGLATLLTSVAGLWQIKKVHTATNSMKDELVASTAVEHESLGRAAGLLEGKALALAEHAEKGKVDAKVVAEAVEAARVAADAAAKVKERGRAAGAAKKGR